MPPEKLKIRESVQEESLWIRWVFDNCVWKVCFAIEYLLWDPKDNKAIWQPCEFFPTVEVKKEKEQRLKKRLTVEDFKKKKITVSRVYLKPWDIIWQLKDINSEYIRFTSQNLNKEVWEKIKTCLTIDNTDINLEWLIYKKYNYKWETNYLVKFTKFDVKNQDNQTKMLEKLRKLMLIN